MMEWVNVTRKLYGMEEEESDQVVMALLSSANKCLWNGECLYKELVEFN